jgi:hypothetical protein
MGPLSPMCRSALRANSVQRRPLKVQFKFTPILLLLLVAADRHSVADPEYADPEYVDPANSEYVDPEYVDPAYDPAYLDSEYVAPGPADSVDVDPVFIDEYQLTRVFEFEQCSNMCQLVLDDAITDCHNLAARISNFSLVECRSPPIQQFESCTRACPPDPRHHGP